MAYRELSIKAENSGFLAVLSAEDSRTDKQKI